MNEIILAFKKKGVKGPSPDILISIVGGGVLCYDYIAKAGVDMQ